MYTLKIILLVMLVSCIIHPIFAQQPGAIPSHLRAYNTLERLTSTEIRNPGSIMMGMPLPPTETVGNTFLNVDWKRTSVLLYEDERLLEGYLVRLDIRTNELNFKIGNEDKVLRGDRVRSFVWTDTLSISPDFFINAKDFVNEENVKFQGFFQVLSDGTRPLLKKTDLEFYKADFNPALNVGSRDNRFVQKSTYYYAINNKVFKVPTNKKKLISIFDKQADEVGKFIKVNSLSLNQDNHLLAIFDYYNSLDKKED